MLILGGSGSGKTNSLFNIIGLKPDIDKIYLNFEDPFKAKYPLLIDKYNPKKPKILITFDNMNACMLSNKKFNLIVTELFIRGRNLNLFLVFITQSYFAAPKKIRVNSTQYSNMKIPSKSLLIIHQISTLKTLRIFTKHIWQNPILF